MSATLTPERPAVDPRVTQRRSRMILIVPVVVGVLINAALRTSADGFATFAAIVLLVAAMITIGPIRSATGRVLLISAVVPSAFLFVRTSPWVVSLDIVAIALLIVLGVSLSRDGRMFDIDFSQIGRGLSGTAAGIAAAPARAIDATCRRLPSIDVDRRRRYGAVIRGLGLALPIALVLGLLLASADGVFASLFHVSFDVAAVPGHVVVVVLAAWIAAGFLLESRQPTASERRSTRITLGPVEGSVVLGGLIVVYALFAWARLLVALRGSDYVLETTGLTYAEYARSGFFQLLWAAGLTLLVLLGLRAVVVLPTRKSRRTFVTLSLVAVGLTLVLVHAALVRLDLYDEVFGLTMLRLYSTIFAWWIGVVFVLTGLALAGVARRRRWLPGALLCSALLTLLFVNVRNPEEIVVQRNVERAALGHEFDVAHALSLSSDARPALVEALPLLSATDRSRALLGICRPDNGTTSWNLSAQRAADATEQACATR